MTKKDDMMKLSQEERTDLRTGSSKFILLFLLLPFFVFPQIPFKGFCKINPFPVDSGLTRILSLNYDRNEYSDLLLYNPLTKQAQLYTGKPSLDFELKKNISFPLQPSRIEPVISVDKSIEAFAFTSRRERSFGIMKFSEEGSPQIRNKYVFSSYPENISLADLDNDGNPEFLISGNSFNGLSILYLKADQFTEKNIISGSTFLNAQFIDLNQDGFKDIAALNSVNNSLDLFFNNSRNDFSQLRTIGIGETVLSISIFDLNYDYFPDIIIGTGSSLRIFFGDETSGFNNILSVKTSSAVNDFVIGDFNRDGYFDLNYLSLSEGKVVTIFAKDYYSFYPEFIHVVQKGIKDIIPFFSRFVYGSAFVNERGGFSILSSTKLTSDDQMLALGVKPAKVLTFDLTDNGINDLVYIDQYDQSLNFILRNPAGRPEILFRANLNEIHKDIIAFDNSGTVKTFFCYSPGKRLVEFLEINFDDFSFKRDYLYSGGHIQDINIRHDPQGNPEIFILFSKNGSLNLEVYTRTTLKYNHKIYSDISGNWLNPVIVSVDDLLIGFWKSNNNLISFNIADLNGVNYVYKNIFQTGAGSSEIFSSSNPAVKKDQLRFVSGVSDEQGITIITWDGNIRLFSDRPGKFDFRITDKNQLFFGKNKSVFINDQDSKSFYRIILPESGKRPLISRISGDFDVENYIITNLDQRNVHLIYTERDKGFINIKQLPK